MGSKKYDWVVAAGAALFAVTGCQSLPSTHELVAIKKLNPNIQQDIRYTSSNNFLGRPVAGYQEAHCYLSQAAARSVIAIEHALNTKGLSLIIYDCYRPQTAVNDFVVWGRDLNDQVTKQDYYPDVPKELLFERGYIAEKSGHSRASTIDIGVVVRDINKARPFLHGDLRLGAPVDMSTHYDFFGEESHTDNPNQPLDVQHNRRWLRDFMQTHGWRNLPEEWWHFTLMDEPFPDRYFDISFEALNQQ